MYKKILTISLLVILLFFVFTVNVFASTYYDFEFTFKDKGFDYPDIKISNSSSGLTFEPQYFFIRNVSGRLYFYASEYPFNIISKTNVTYTFECNTGLVASFILEEEASSWKVNSLGSSTPYSVKSTADNIFYSSYDIYYNGELLVEAYGTPLFRSVRSIKTLDSVLNETISILPITLTVVVGLVAIRKGISFVTLKLRKA